MRMATDQNPEYSMLVFLVVFNTEAHPFAAPPAQSTYGNATLLSQTAWQIQQTGPLPAISTLAFPLPTSVTIGVAATAAVSV